MGSPLAAPSIISFLSFILVLIPLRWHWRTKNIAALSMALWLAEANLFNAIATAAWSDNVEVRLARFCNIGECIHPRR